MLHKNNGWLNIVQIAKGQPVTSAAAYLIPAMLRPNLDIIVNSQVTKILQTGTKDGQPVFSAIQFYTVGGKFSMKYHISCRHQWVELRRLGDLYHQCQQRDNHICRCHQDTPALYVPESE